MTQARPPRRRPRLSLRQRFAFSFAVLLALLVLMAGVSQLLLTAMGGRVQRIVEVNNRQMALGHAMIDQLNEMAIALRTLSLVPGLKEAEAQVRLLAQATATCQRTEEELSAQLQTGAATRERELLGQIAATRAAILPLVAKAAKLGGDGDGEGPEAAVVLMNEVRPVELAWRRLVGQLVLQQSQRNADTYAEARRAQGQASIALTAVAAVALALGTFLAWQLARSVLRPVEQAIRTTERIAEGDLSGRVDNQRHDELGRLLVAVAGMQDRLSLLVGDIRFSADAIATASSEIAAGDHDLSHRTEQQAASLQATASGMAQLTGTVQLNAGSARQADRLVAAASEIAMRGGVVVEQVVSTMADISASSRRVVDIIGVIDGIAFQTNILALNAAVEAARAGEQGRGFAVVAGEVRTLARRSAEAAREIKALISDSGARVESGARLVTEAGGTMREIVASIQGVTCIVSEISASTREQGSGIENMSTRMHQLDQMTQQNAALVEQSTAATASLKSQADRLAQAVRAFRLEAAGA